MGQRLVQQHLLQCATAEQPIRTGNGQLQGVARGGTLDTAIILSAAYRDGTSDPTTQCNPVGFRRAAASDRYGVSAEIINQKQKTIAFLSNPRFDFLEFNPAALQEPGPVMTYASQRTLRAELPDQHQG